MKEKKPNFIKYIVIGYIILMVIVLGISSCDNSNEPWKDLGISKSEYIDIYSYFRYGN